MRPFTHISQFILLDIDNATVLQSVFGDYSDSTTR